MICQRRAMLFAEWLLVALDCFTWKLCKNTVEKCPNFLPNSIWEQRYTPSKSEEFVDNGPLSTRCQQPSTQLSTAEPQPRTRKLGKIIFSFFKIVPKPFLLILNHLKHYLPVIVFPKHHFDQSNNTWKTDWLIVNTIVNRDPAAPAVDNYVHRRLLTTRWQRSVVNELPRLWESVSLLSDGVR